MSPSPARVMGDLKREKVTGNMGRPEIQAESLKAVFGEDALLLLSDESDGGVLRGEL